MDAQHSSTPHASRRQQASEVAYLPHESVTSKALSALISAEHVQTQILERDTHQGSFRCEGPCNLRRGGGFGEETMEAPVAQAHAACVCLCVCVCGSGAEVL